MITSKDARQRTQAQRIAPVHTGHPLESTHRQYHQDLYHEVEVADPQIYQLLGHEFQRQQDTLQLIAAENRCSRAVLGALGTIIQNKTTEGFAGARFHGGCEVADQLETLAIERAKQVFKAQYANVQAHCGTSANHIVYNALLEPGDTILCLGLDQGGHVSHGAAVSQTGKVYHCETYVVDPETYCLDYDLIAQRARTVRPKLIICGASAYPRTLDFARFRAIADEVGAYLLADVSHIAGLIAAGLHPSPIDHAHVTTTSTYKPGGPRGGLILMGRDADSLVTTSHGERTLARQMDKMTFPGVQGTPYLNHIAGKAVFFAEMLEPVYQLRQRMIMANALVLAERLNEHGFDVLTGQTDNHMVLINVAHYRDGLTGVIAQRCLEQCGIIINMNRLPYDPYPQAITSGIRLGTPVVTRNGMGPQQMAEIADYLAEILSKVEIIDQACFRLDPEFAQAKRQAIRELCQRFPVH